MPAGHVRRFVIPYLLVPVVAAGCGERASSELAAPDLETSRAALVATLDAWKANHRGSGTITGSKPAIGVVDSTRTERPLVAYEVVGPLMVDDKARPFAVRLSLDSPRETVTARYLVVGRDPLWVFRQEDFDRMIHWEHKMDGDQAVEPPAAAERLPAAPTPGGRASDVAGPPDRSS